MTSPDDELYPPRLRYTGIMGNTFGGGMENLWNWALQLLKEKGHTIGEAFCRDGIVVIDIDGIPEIPEEAIGIAARYAEWPERERGHLEYLRSLQSTVS